MDATLQKLRARHEAGDQSALLQLHATLLRAGDQEGADRLLPAVVTELRRADTPSDNERARKLATEFILRRGATGGLIPHWLQARSMDPGDHNVWTRWPGPPYFNGLPSLIHAESEADRDWNLALVRGRPVIVPRLIARIYKNDDEIEFEEFDQGPYLVRVDSFVRRPPTSAVESYWKIRNVYTDPVGAEQRPDRMLHERHFGAELGKIEVCAKPPAIEQQSTGSWTKNADGFLVLQSSRAYQLSRSGGTPQ